jgi:LmbE family N-acetylglucosaminyl deacetylase
MITANRLHQLWRNLPLGSLDDIVGYGTCLILAPHPDDESLGCGGLIATCCAAARPPLVAVLTDGGASHPRSKLYPPPRLAALREAEATDAVRLLGLASERLIFLRQEDGGAPRVGPAFATVTQRLTALLQDAGCTAIVAPWQFDPHCDHEAAALIAREAARRTGVRLCEYPVWGWTLSDETPIDEGSVHGWRLDVTRHLPAKWRAIGAHASQHGHVITDDPAGFCLTGELLQALETPCETFLLT